VAPDALFLRVCLDQADLRGFASRELEIANGFAVDREDRAGAAELRRHVAKAGPIRKWQIREPVAEKFDELADGTFPAQHFRHGKHEVGSGSALPQSAAQLEAENLRYQHRDRLAQHRGFGLDAANTPAQYPKPVNHGGVRVRAHQRIGISGTRAVLRHVEYDPAKVFKVDLVHDPGVRRHDPEVLERFLAPAEEGVAFLVALELDLVVQVERICRAVAVDLHGVVNDQFRG